MKPEISVKSSGEFFPSKDAESESPIPRLWRRYFDEVVSCFAAKDYRLTRCVSSNVSVSESSSRQIKVYVEDYGQALIPLPEEAWNTSVCLWGGGVLGGTH